MDRLEQLREDLLARWRGAFDRIERPRPLDQTHIGRRLYANNSRFDLRDYRPDDFPVGGRALKEPPKESSFYYTYLLDDRDRPVHMSARHTFNKIDWEGIYLYSDSEAEYIEFCLQTKVVNDYSRIALLNDLPVTFQHFKVNGGGSHLGGRTGKKAIDFIVSSPLNYFIEVEEYDSTTGRIISGRALSEGLGAPLTRSALEYSYSPSGKLLQVTRTHDTGWKTTDFAAQTARTADDLAVHLSEKIAAHAVEALKGVCFDSPLLTVELFYRGGATYVPHLFPVTEQGFSARPGPAATLEHKQSIDLVDQVFEPEMKEFVDRLNNAEDWEPGIRMLRNAARLITHDLPQLVPTSDCFVAFPIDWELEGHELEAILQECGATHEAITKLKTIGWLD